MYPIIKTKKMSEPISTDVVHVLGVGRNNVEECEIVTIGENNHQIRFLDENGTKLYRAQDIGKILGIKSIRSSLESLHCKDHKYRTVQSGGGNQNTSFLTHEGVRKIIALSRKPFSLDVAQHFGIRLHEDKVICQETITIRQIMKAFHGELMCLQHRVQNYQIDLYFPAYKLAIECDENSHNNTVNIEKDAIREAFIIQHLDCAFIRYKVDCHSFDIFKVINDIYNHIKSTPSVN